MATKKTREACVAGYSNQTDLQPGASLKIVFHWQIQIDFILSDSNYKKPLFTDPQTALSTLFIVTIVKT